MMRSKVRIILIGLALVLGIVYGVSMVRCVFHKPRIFSAQAIRRVDLYRCDRREQIDPSVPHVELPISIVRAAIGSARYESGGTAMWKARFAGVIELTSGEKVPIEVNALRSEFAVDGDMCGRYVVGANASDAFLAEVARAYTESFHTQTRIDGASTQAAE